MEQNVRYYWILGQANLLCLSHIIHAAYLYIYYPKFASKMQRIQVANGQFISVLFIIPIVIDIHGHRFKIFILVSEMNENIDIVFGIKIYLS